MSPGASGDCREQCTMGSLRVRAEAVLTLSLAPPSYYRIFDACSGAAVASIGHGDPRVISKIAEQLTKLSYHHTSRLTNPVR